MLDRGPVCRDRILTTEENAECWIDQLDALLLVNTPNWGRIIPLFPAVYSGRTITFGFQYFRADDLTMSLPFRLKTAMAFTYGSQLGWIKVSQVMAPEVAKEAEFLRDLARCRRFGHAFLVYGRFLGLLDVGGDNPSWLELDHTPPTAPTRTQHRRSRRNGSGRFRRGVYSVNQRTRTVSWPA